MGVTTAACMILLTCPCVFFSAESKERRELAGPEAKQSRSASPCEPADFILPPFKPNNPLGETHVTNIHPRLNLNFVFVFLLFEMKMMLWGVLMVFLHRSRVCGSHIRVFLQSLLHLLPEGEHGQGAPLQQPQALWKPAGTLTRTHRSMTHTALQVGNTSYSFVCWQKYYQKHKQRPPKPSATSSDWSEPSTEMKHSSQLLAVRRCKNVCLVKTSETLFNRFADWFFENVSHIVIMLTHTVYTHTQNKNI